MSEGKDDGALSAQKQRPVFPLVGHLSREPRLAGKVCVVSGASRGFGAAIAIRFVEEGAKVVCLSRGGCDETLELIGQIDGVEVADVPKLAISVQCDISSEVRQFFSASSSPTAFSLSQKLRRSHAATAYRAQCYRVALLQLSDLDTSLSHYTHPHPTPTPTRRMMLSACTPPLRRRSATSSTCW